LIHAKQTPDSRQMWRTTGNERAIQAPENSQKSPAERGDRATCGCVLRCNSWNMLPGIPPRPNRASQKRYVGEKHSRSHPNLLPTSFTHYSGPAPPVPCGFPGSIPAFRQALPLPNMPLLPPRPPFQPVWIGGDLPPPAPPFNVVPGPMPPRKPPLPNFQESVRTYPPAPPYYPGKISTAWSVSAAAVQDARPSFLRILACPLSSYFKER
jgi:hypothetical protein